MNKSYLSSHVSCRSASEAAGATDARPSREEGSALQQKGNKLIHLKVLSCFPFLSDSRVPVWRLRVSSTLTPACTVAPDERARQPVSVRGREREGTQWEGMHLCFVSR